jgi:hypothetical protein
MLGCGARRGDRARGPEAACAAEVVSLKVSDVDSKRMVIRVE